MTVEPIIIATNRRCLNCDETVEMIWICEPGNRVYMEDYRPKTWKTSEWEFVCPECGFVMRFVEGLSEGKGLTLEVPSEDALRK